MAIARNHRINEKSLLTVGPVPTGQISSRRAGSYRPYHRVLGRWEPALLGSLNSFVQLHVVDADTAMIASFEVNLLLANHID